MAVRYRTATGNWSNAAQWDGGTLPTSADDCYCNGFTITLDQDVVVLSIQNGSLASPVIAAGGSVNITTITTSRTITANLFCNTTTNLLNLAATTGTLNIVGNGTRGNTGNGGAVLLLNNSAGCTVNWTGNIQSGVGGGNSNGVAVSTSFGNFFHTGTLTGTTFSICVYLNTSGARTISVGTVGPNGLYVSGGTGSGHSVTVANIDNTIAGFSTAQVCVAFGAGIISSATINTVGDILTGTSLACSFTQSSGSGLVRVNVNSGNGDIYWPSGAGAMINVNTGTGCAVEINCRDIYGFRVGSPNGHGVIALSGSVAQTLTINARDLIAPTVSGINASGTVINAGTVASVVLILNLSGSNGACGGTGNVTNIYGAVNQSLGTFYLNGIARGSSSTAGGANSAGFINMSTGTAFVTKAVSKDFPNAGITGAQFGTIQSNTNGFITIDNSEDGSGGWPASSGRHFVRAGSSGSVKMRESNLGVLKTFGANPTDYPAPVNVRDGTTYNSGTQTGTLKVPPVGSVAVGVPTDNTVGTAVINAATPADIAAAVATLQSSITSATALIPALV